MHPNSVHLIIAMTGHTGTGKSFHLNKEKDKLGDRFYLIDCMEQDAKFIPPNRDSVDIVALDHVAFNEESSNIFNDALAWTRKNRKILIVAEQLIEDFHEHGIRLPSDYFVINLNGLFNSGKGVTVTLHHGTKKLTFLEKELGFLLEKLPLAKTNPKVFSEMALFSSANSRWIH